jgi:hypothetical protein
LEALRAQAKKQGRSVSGSITHLVKEEVAARVATRKASKKLTGFLSHLEVPGSIDAWNAARRAASKKLAPLARKSRRSRTSP